MAMFPAFLPLQDKRCLVVGGGKVAARKIHTLMRFCPNITVVSPEICDTIQQLKYQNKVIVIRKKYSEEDMENITLVIAATDSPAVNDRICADAKSRGILVNVVDSPEKCTFVFPSVVVRKDLVVGISTSGSFPALSKKVREKIEDVLPEFYGDMISSLKDWRQRAEKEISDSGKRKDLLNRILDEVLFYENAVTDTQLTKRVNKIFEEYADEKSD